MEAQVAALQQELAANKAMIDQLQKSLQIAQEVIERNRNQLNEKDRELGCQRREEDARNERKEESHRQMIRDAQESQRHYGMPVKNWYDYKK